MFYYKFNNLFCSSFQKIDYLNLIDEIEVINSDDHLYFLKEYSYNSRAMLVTTNPEVLFFNNLDASILNSHEETEISLPQWLVTKFHLGYVTVVNITYVNWQDIILSQIKFKQKEKFTISIAGLGDVGSSLVTALKLIGGNLISKIQIYDISNDRIERLEKECNQICFPDNSTLPFVVKSSLEHLFDCDMFVFCVSKNISLIDANKNDIRLVQYDTNLKIIKQYVELSKKINYNGYFTVMSDPVDLLCNDVYFLSNTNIDGIFDRSGLIPDNIIGYGLGVMHGRACYYSSKYTKFKSYLEEGRIFGPHGKDLIVANSVSNYNNELSLELTDLVVNANMDIRNNGFKPYIAPSIDSGAISILYTLSGKWHYSSTFIDGIYIGVKNRMTPFGEEIECVKLSQILYDRINETIRRLQSYHG